MLIYPGKPCPSEKSELTRDELSEKIRTLEERLLESEQIIHAIGAGEVDAFIVHEPSGEQIYTLKGADHGYRVLVESITKGALILSSDDSVYYCNRTLGEMLGLPIQKIISRKLECYVDSEGCSRLMEIIGESRSSGAARGEFLMKRNGGTLLPVNISLNRISVSSFEGVCAVVTDLTEQKQAEEELKRRRAELEVLIHELQVHQAELKMQNDELRKAQAQLEESRMRYVDLYDFAPIGYLTLDVKGQVLKANLAAAAQLGTERARLIGSIFPLYVDPKDREQARLHIMRVFKTRGRQTCELRLKSKGGEEFDARLESIFIEDTGGEGLCRTTVSDISYAKRAEEALHRAHDELEERVRERTAELLRVNEQLRDEIAERKRAEVLLQRQAELLHLAYDPIIVWQLGGPIESWSKGAEELYGYSQEEAVGHVTHDLLKTIHPVPWPQIEAKLHEQRFWEGEIKHHTRGGRALIISARKQLVRGTDGVERVLEVNRDITERKQMEEDLRKSRDELELRVKERTAELELANEKLRLMPSTLIAVQENERKRLAGDLHDSIGQTLAALKFRIEHVLTTIEKPECTQAHHLLHQFVPVLQRSIDETRAIYMGLKPMILSESGILAALDWYRLEILKVYPNPHIELETSVREEDIPEDLKTAIFRIVQEALNNTSKHGQSEWVDVRLAASDGAVELEISDDGIGMDLDYIMESSTAKSLGLIGMRERTEITGGPFTIKSALNEGTTIRAVWRTH
jgi:PAS domain S-box-containing protein